MRRNLNPFPAGLKYDASIDDYKGHLAAIQPLDTPPWTEGNFWEWFFKIACAHAAGGVVSRKLMPSRDGGDGNDKDRFKVSCDNSTKNIIYTLSLAIGGVGHSFKWQPT